MIHKTEVGHYRLTAPDPAIEALVGILHDPSRPTMTIEQMSDAIAEGGAESGLRGVPPEKLVAND